MGRRKTTEVDAMATKSRIIEAAENLFRKVGYSKTTVADIASALGMSPANIYRYFATKAHINEAICDRLVRHIELRCRESISGDDTSTNRLKRFILEYHKTIMANIIKEKRLYDMVSVAMDEHWPVIQEHSERMMDSLRIIIERGIALGEFRNNNAVETTKTVYQAIAYFIYPSLIEHAVNDAKNNEQAHSMEEDLKQLLDLMLNGLRSGV